MVLFQNDTITTLENGTLKDTIRIIKEYEDLKLRIYDADEYSGSRDKGRAITNDGISLAFDVYDTRSPFITSFSPESTLLPEISILEVGKDLKLVFNEEIQISSNINEDSKITIVDDNLPVNNQIHLKLIDKDKYTIEDSVLTLHLPAYLESGMKYHVIIEADIINDAPNNDENIGPNNINEFNYFEGLLTSDAWNWQMKTGLQIVKAKIESNTPESDIYEIILEFNQEVGIYDSVKFDNTIGWKYKSENPGIIDSITVTDGSLAELAKDKLRDIIKHDKYLNLFLNSPIINTQGFTSILGDIIIQYTDNNPSGIGLASRKDVSNQLSDIDGNFLRVDLDNVAPELDSAIISFVTNPWDKHSIRLVFSEKIKINKGFRPTDFKIRDGRGTTFTIASWIQSEDGKEIHIKVYEDLSATIVGNLSVKYEGSKNNISDFGFNNLRSNQSVTTILDTREPEFVDLYVDLEKSEFEVYLKFDEPVKIRNINNSDFSVTDSKGEVFNVFRVKDGIPQDSLIILKVENIANLTGNLTVTYTNNNNKITDFASNDAPSATRTKVLDTQPPEIVNVELSNENTILVRFNEQVQIPKIASTTFLFELKDLLGNTFNLSSQQSDNNNEIFNLTFDGLENSIGDLLLTYRHDADEYIKDFAGNPLNSITSEIRINRQFELSPILDEEDLSFPDKDYYSESNILGDSLLLLRTGNSVNGIETTFSLRDLVPFKITPRIDGSTIKIYSDASLSKLVTTKKDVKKDIGFKPKVGELFASLSSQVDFSGQNNSGIYTFYITETEIRGKSSEGPPTTYTIAILDRIRNNTNLQFFADNNQTKVNLSIQSPNDANQAFEFKGDALTNISSSGATFNPNFLAIATYQLSIEVSSSKTDIKAKYYPPELLFEVYEIPQVFEDGENIQYSFSEKDKIELSNLNNNLVGIDVGGGTDYRINDDFYGYALFLLDANNNVVNDVAEDNNDIFGNTSMFISTDPDLNFTNADLASKFLVYSNSNSYSNPYSGNNNNNGNGNPVFIDGSWSFKLPEFKNFLDANNFSTEEVQILKLVSISINDIGQLSTREKINEALYIFIS